MTSKDQKRENQKEAQAFKAAVAAPDSRLIALVHLIARRAAQRDFDQALKRENAARHSTRITRKHP